MGGRAWERYEVGGNGEWQRDLEKNIQVKQEMLEGNLNAKWKRWGASCQRWAKVSPKERYQVLGIRLNERGSNFLDLSRQSNSVEIGQREIRVKVSVSQY